MKKNDLILFACIVASIIFLMNSGTVFAKIPSKTDIKIMVINEAQNSTVPPEIALAVARVESNFNPRALSSAGARGVMQIMPKTARDVFGVDEAELWDARLNIQLGIDYLAQLYHQYGRRWDLALSHYNGGTLRGNGKFAKPHSYTRRYVSSVMSWRQKYARRAIVWQAGSQLDRMTNRSNLNTERERLSEKLKYNVAKLDRLRRDRLQAGRNASAYLDQFGMSNVGCQEVVSDHPQVRREWDADENSGEVIFDVGFEARLRRVRGTLDDFAHLLPRDKTS